MTEGLFNIGTPAIPALLDRITQTDDQDLVGRYVTICKRIEGREVTHFRLQGLLEKEKDPQNRKRIESALDILGKQKSSSER